MRFAYLNLKEQPRGNSMLASLLAAGFEPELIVEEDSKLAARGRRTLRAGLAPLAT